MQTYEFETVCSAIDKLDERKAFAICMVNAKKLLPIIACVALPDTYKAIESCLTQCFSALMSSSSGELMDADRMIRGRLKTTSQIS